MTSIFNKFKSLITGAIVLALFIGVTLSSCTPDKKSKNAEKVEEASTTEEHPASGEHPSGEEHPTDEEHPSGEEHPSDSTKQE